MPGGIGKSVWLLRRFGCLLLLAQFAPAFVLLGLRGVGGFFVFEPETEPVHCAALRSHARCGIREDMLTRIQKVEIYRLLQIAKGGIRLLHEEQA
jgi:hypothetical protein